MKLNILVIMVLVALVGQSAILAQDSETLYWKSFHRANDREWSRRTGLPPEDVRKLRLAAEIADDEPSNPINLIDSRTLSQQHILLVIAEGVSGQCLTVIVYERRGEGIGKLWSGMGMPDGSGFCGSTFCGRAAVHAEKRDRVIVSIPVPFEGSNICDERIVLTYQGKGSTYELSGTQHIPIRCSVDNYERAVTESFSEGENSVPRGSERMVTVHDLPSLGPENVLAIEKTPDGLAVSRLAFRESLWRRLALFKKFHTPSQCIAAAKLMQVDRTPLNISPEEVQRFLNDLHKINYLETKSCPLDSTGNCAGYAAGAFYIVLFNDGLSLRLTDVRRLKEMRSENPALLNWVYEFLQYVKAHDSQPSQ
jgi:hypothetical protein